MSLSLCVHTYMAHYSISASSHMLCTRNGAYIPAEITRVCGHSEGTFILGRSSSITRLIASQRTVDADDWLRLLEKCEDGSIRIKNETVFTQNMFSVQNASKSSKPYFSLYRVTSVLARIAISHRIFFVHV